MIKVNEQYITADVEDIIAELKSQLAINGIQRFYRTIDTPRNLMVCCPFHKDGQERKPSMGIYKKDGTCHCFACEWVGNITELISNCFGYDDLGVYGSKWLVQNFLTLSVESRNDIDLDFSRKPKVDTPIVYISEKELDSYRYIHPYMYERKLTDEVIEMFDIGYDKLTQCLTFPVRDIEGHCLFVARRSVNSKFFNYPSGIEKPLYGLYELSELAKIHEGHWENNVIVCESMLDALTCWVYGKVAVALNGLGNDLQFKQLSELPCRALILATDSDSAGMKARKRISQNVHNKIITQYILPEGRKDINELTEDEFNNLQETFI